MKKLETHKRRPGLLALVAAAVVLAAACALALPTTARADDTLVAHTVDASGRRRDCTSIEQALGYGYQGAWVYLDTDWDLESKSLDIAEGKSITIDLNGHKITSQNSRMTVLVREKASLKLTSTAQPRDFSYRGYNKVNPGDVADEAWEWADLTVSAGGLVTNCNNGRGAGRGISVAEGATLTVQNVAVAGCVAGLYLQPSSTANLTSATICHNKGDNSNSGSGVYMRYRTTLNMNASHVDDNYSSSSGGGIYAESNTTINLENNSTVSRNATINGGGGIFTNGSCTVKSSDNTGVLEGNAALQQGSLAANLIKSGGAILVGYTSSSTRCLIEGLAIKDNYSAYDAGGIELDQESAIVRGCTITGNAARCDGGGIYVFNDYNTIDTCTIRDNYCNAKGGNYEGGGVFVSYRYDIKMAGAVVVKDNTRGKGTGNADDVFLGTISTDVSKAYITGSLAQGSSVGVRTGMTGACQIAKNLSYSSKDCLFMDLDGYYVRYWVDDGDAAQENGDAAWYTVSLNGKGWAVREAGTTSRIYAPGDCDGKVFWYWDEKETKGLWPVDDFIYGEKKYNPALTLKMPQNDVYLAMVQADTIKGAVLAVEAPKAGEDLSASGQLIRTDRGVGAQSVPTGVSWYEVGENGETTLATGTAKAGTTYVARIAAPRLQVLGAFYDSGISADAVTVRGYSAGAVTSEAKAAKVSVDSSTGTFTAESGEFKTAGEKPAATETGTVKVQLKSQGLMGGSGDEAAAALADDGDAGAGDEGDAAAGDTAGLIKEIEVTYDKASDKVSIAAPHVDGYNFCNWDGVQSGWVSDDVKGVVEIPASALAGAENIIACYTPVATALKVSMNAPETGKALATTCADIEMTCSDGRVVSLAEEAGVEGGFKVTWSPDDETAWHLMTYVAAIELGDGSGLEGAGDALALDAKVTCNGVEASSAGFIVDENGKLCLVLAFPETADESAEPDDKGDADADTDKGDTGADKDDADADKGGEKIDEKADDAGDNGNEPQVTTTTTTTVTKATKAKTGTPSTGDITFTAAGALLVLAGLCFALAAFSRKRHHKE